MALTGRLRLDGLVRLGTDVMQLTSEFDLTDRIQAIVWSK